MQHDRHQMHSALHASIESAQTESALRESAAAAAHPDAGPSSRGGYLNLRLQSTSLSLLLHLTGRSLLMSYIHTSFG
jgi:hypothetical protein